MENILEKVYQSGLKFLTALTPEETYTTIVKEAMKLVGAKYGSILLEEQGELKRVYASSPAMYKIRPRKRGIMYHVFKDKTPQILKVDQIKRLHPEIKKLEVKWDIIVPLAYQEKSIGVLTVLSSKDRPFQEKDLKVLQMFSPMATLAIRKTQLYNETKKALETRDLFISMAAHELRTPLTTIHGYVQLLNSRLKNQDTQESRWVEQLSLETSRLAQLVNELLEVNRIKTGKLQYVWRMCSLREVISRALADFRFTHADRKVVFEDQLGGQKDMVVGDFDKLLQVTINLLDNAAKFSSPDKEIIVTLKSRPSYFILTVKDVGKGIAREELPKIFEGFYRGKNSPKESIGLGLFLAKNIIDQHRGSIRIHSRLNKGTLVEVRLQRAKV